MAKPPQGWAVASWDGTALHTQGAEAKWLPNPAPRSASVCYGAGRRGVPWESAIICNAAKQSLS